MMCCGYPTTAAVLLMVGRGEEIGFFLDEMEWGGGGGGKTGTDKAAQRAHPGPRVQGGKT
jgi:hypothetical protein